MNSTTHALGADHAEHDHDPRSMALLGFWIYLMSDCILFASVFAAYVTLSGAMAGNPGETGMFDLPYVAMETACLLVSSFTYGLAVLAMEKQRSDLVMRWLGVTFLLGAAFISMELLEFYHLIEEGAGPGSTAFMSAFFTLVGTHGAHVFAGLIWMVVLMAQLVQRGLTPVTQTRVLLLSLFWHFLDIIWIGVFTVVYLRGAMA